MFLILKAILVVNVVHIANGEISNEMTAEDNETYYASTYSDTACLFTQENATLQSADARNFRFPEDSIFFIETSCRGGLEFRQACSVETAARAHQNRQINVLFAGRDTAKSNATKKFLESLKAYKNVKFYKIHVPEYVKGTPLEELVAKDLKLSRYLVHHASDVLRFLTLYKFGGIYLDLDVFVVKSLDHLPVKKNWIGRDSDAGLAVGLLALSKSGIGKEVINAIIKNLKSDFKTDNWGANSIGVTTKSLEQVCSMKWKKITPATCRGFKIYEPRYFYPLKSGIYEQFLQPVNGSLNLTNVYAFHVWNYLTYGEDIPEDSLHAILTRKYCPYVDKANHNISRDDDDDGSETNVTSPPQIRTIRVQRSKVNMLYENIEINLKEKLLKRKADPRHFVGNDKGLSLRKPFHLHHSSAARPLPGRLPRRMPPHLHAKPYTPLRFILRKTSRATKR